MACVLQQVVETISMGNNETRTLWISVFAALMAVFLLYSYTQEKTNELTKKFGAKQRVVIAAEDINEMETVDETKLEIVERPVDFIEPQAIKDPEVAVGMVALAPIKKGEQILQSKVMEPGPVTGLSLQVAPGKRAISVPVSDLTGVAKLIKPGDRIDLIASLTVGGGANSKTEVKTIMQDKVILATGLKVVNELPRLFERQGKDNFIKNLRGDTNFSSITLELTPKESQDLIYILSTNPGGLYIALRHPSDRTKNKISSSSVESVIGRTLRSGRRSPASNPPVIPSRSR